MKLSEQARNLCYAIESIPASKQQTEASGQAAELAKRIRKIESVTVDTCGICGKVIAPEDKTVEDVECGTCCAEHFTDISGE